MSNCPHCGMIHQTTCPRVKAIEYNPDGTVRRIEFHAPTAPIYSRSTPADYRWGSEQFWRGGGVSEMIERVAKANLRIIDGIANSFGGVVVRE
jgi:hypothetical protein